MQFREILRGVNMTDSLTDGFPYSTFQKAKLPHMVAATVQSKGEPQPSPA